MPQTAAIIDALRAEFGASGINDSIRKGMKGEVGYFYSSEAGHEVGTRDPREGVMVAPVQRVDPRNLPAQRGARG